jgi:hypothetical protein
MVELPRSKRVDLSEYSSYIAGTDAPDCYTYFPRISSTAFFSKLVCSFNKAIVPWRGKKVRRKSTTGMGPTNFPAASAAILTIFSSLL